MSASPLATPLPWDLVSSAYNEEVVPQLAHFAREALRLAAAPPGSRVVDVACGPGTLAFLAASAGHRVDAIDFSPEMLSYLDARALREGNDRITSQLGDGQALPYADATFGAAFSMFGLMFFPDRAAGFRELRRVLVPGARAVVSSWPQLEEHPVFTPMFEAISAALGSQPSPRSAPLATEDACNAEMSAAFGGVEVHRIEHVERASSADELWTRLSRTMAPLVLLRKNLGVRFAAVDEAAAAAIRTAVGAGPVELPMHAWLAVGVAV